MKLIVTGATGFVGREVIRQALKQPSITTVIALTRNSMPNLTGLGSTSRLQSVVLEDWTAPYPQEIKTALRGADACIWALAVTPTKSKNRDFAEVTKVCHDFTIHGLNAMSEVANKPFRFVYTSGVTIERDQNAKLNFLADYRLMRGRTENEIITFAKQHAPDVEATVAKPAHIEGPGRDSLSATAKAFFEEFGSVTSVHVSELAAAMIDQCINGITKDPLSSGDLQEVGKGLLNEEDYLR